jgi:hypothetical protein
MYTFVTFFSTVPTTIATVSSLGGIWEPDKVDDGDGWKTPGSWKGLLARLGIPWEANTENKGF